jgi:hypothetical protein
MTNELRQKTKIPLALTIAQGRSVALWARDNLVPRSTAYRWAGQPDLQAAAESRRQRAVNCALARLAKRAYREAQEVVALAECAESESVRLCTLRAVVSGAMPTSKLAPLKRRMSAIKQELQERPGTAGPPCPAAPCSLVDERSQIEKGAILSHFFGSARGLSGQRARSATRVADVISDIDGPFLATPNPHGAQEPQGGPTVPADVHCPPVSLLCAAEPVCSSLQPTPEARPDCCLQVSEFRVPHGRAGERSPCSQWKRGSAELDFPADHHPEEGLTYALRGGIGDAFPEGLVPRPELPRHFNCAG